VTITDGDAASGPAETAADFLAARRDWFRVEAVDYPNGSWDVMLRIDGTYRSEALVTRQEMIDYFTRWINDILNP
jgi:hypothetical protein